MTVAQHRRALFAMIHSLLIFVEQSRRQLGTAYANELIDQLKKTEKDLRKRKRVKRKTK